MADEEPKKKEENIFEPEEPPQKPCDPATMDCDQLRDAFQELARDKQEVDATVKQLESSKLIFGDPTMDKALETAKEHQILVNEQISDIIEASFGKNCRKPRDLSPERDE